MGGDIPILPVYAFVVWIGQLYFFYFALQTKFNAVQRKLNSNSNWIFLTDSSS
jgi:hypothetical protein